MNVAWLYTIHVTGAHDPKNCLPLYTKYDMFDGTAEARDTPNGIALGDAVYPANLLKNVVDGVPVAPLLVTGMDAMMVDDPFVNVATTSICR